MSPKIILEQTDNQSVDSITEPMAQETGRTQKRKSKAPWVVLTAVIIVLAGLGFIFRDKLKLGVASQKASNYQAVFLSNGQVYFGKLSDENSTYVALTDIYYLQVVQDQQLQGQQAAQSGQSPQISLVKLGNELHGPVDAMKINRSQILFFEDLKQDSQVVTAIRDYAQKPQSRVAGAAQQQNPSQPQAPAENAPGTSGK